MLFRSPKLEALTVAEAQLREAENDLAGAMKRLDKCNAHLAGLKEQFEAQMAEKTRVEEGARALERRPTARCTAYPTRKQAREARAA